jgi:hypothetical protein
MLACAKCCCAGFYVCIVEDYVAQFTDDNVLLVGRKPITKENIQIIRLKCMQCGYVITNPKLKVTFY